MDEAILNQEIFLSYYGDDFTGSTDVLETLALNGIPAALFLEAPERQEIEQFELKAGIGALTGSKKIKAFGVAGISRSQDPLQMDRELPGIFEKIQAIPTDFFHYKICSTFDSAAKVGNIGHAVELALKYFPASYVPLIVGAPYLNRFVVFGNLFARVAETTFRLDRHPTMSKHPVTPMKESDLRRHLKLQTSRVLQLMDMFALEGQYGDPERYLRSLISTKSSGYVLFDTLTIDHLRIIGRLLLDTHRSTTSLLVGSSGVEFALVHYLQQQGKIKKPPQVTGPGVADKMVVTAGSAAPGTASQIRYMESLGHQGIRMNTVKLLSQEHRSREIKSLVEGALDGIARGQVPLLYTAMGPDDNSIVATSQAADERGLTSGETGSIIARAQGTVLKEIISQAGKLRVVVAGGDTSGYVSRVLGIYALETLCPIAPGAPLCVAHSNNPQFDGLEIALKGGQNGNEKYFESILKGKLIN